ncbi:cytochrome c biogenesis protein CcdA [Azospirillum sp. B4]|uniref:redoxin domain-containing protein n=1 Tax=Azospirillum sp. B4 TaxID=95605 RepID=UPI00034C530E|nr:cytochrome c biogenesis protein CcdA [Azospirillum sp. B4]
MASILLAYLAGVLTIAAPCILPLLPIVLAPALADGAGFRRRGLPLLLGLAAAFAATASLAAAGGWAVAANQYGRAIGQAVVALFGLAMMWPALAARLAAPLVAMGSGLVERFSPNAALNADGTVASSLALGLATGLMWAPCAGPILGLVLSAAALHGPGLDTTVALFFYALGAATPLAVIMVGGGRLARVLPRVLPGRASRWADGLRRVAGGAVIATTIISAAGLDARLFLGVPALPTDRVERALVKVLGALEAGVAHAATLPVANQAQDRPPLTGPLAEVLKAKAWVNSPGLAADDLRGRVVLVNFWTYSCINCLRALPHVRQWAAQYRDQGLVVVGVHTPEFAFERDIDNITRAAATLDVTYPVAVDSDYRIWRAFDNQAWPALYLVGPDGRIIHQALGEGDYDKTDRVIRKALADAQAAPAPAPVAPVKVEGTQAAADLNDLASSETYVGYGEGQRYSGPDDIVADAAARYRPVSGLRLNRWTLGGDWTVGREYATAGQAGARIAYRFHARDLHLVLAPGADGRPVRFRVRIDGAAPGADHGTDVDADGLGTVRAAKLYQLVRQAGPVADHTFEIEFLDAGARAYAFTFG